MDCLGAAEYYSRKFVTNLINHISKPEELEKMNCSSASLKAKIDCNSQDNAASTSCSTKAVSSTKPMSNTTKPPMGRRVPKLKITPEMLNRGEKKTILSDDESDEDLFIPLTYDNRQVRRALYQNYEEEEVRFLNINNQMLKL